MTSGDLTHYRQVLLDKRDELTRALAAGGGSMRNETDRLADSVDQAARALEADVEVRLRQNGSRLLRAIEAALVRIERRTFGVLRHSAQPIPPARLNVVPWARLCRDCKEQQEPGVFEPGTRGSHSRPAGLTRRHYGKPRRVSLVKPVAYLWDS